MTNLSVNLNKVALLRNTRNFGRPSVIEAAATCIKAGAQGITVHPRPDQRHIKPADVDALSQILSVEFNIEGYPSLEFLDIIRKIKPTQCTLVPDAPDAFTSDHGWDLAVDGAWLKPIIQELKDLGIRVSLFMDADLSQIQRAKEIGSDRIELYTEPYATAFRNGNVESVFQQYHTAAEKAQEIGLGVNAGHDLNLHNLEKFCSIPGILEVSIGHALIADALDIGLFTAVKEYLQILTK
ncbi:pyridoxine 5'-phosphate synthase [Nostoc sp. UHCC 0302]|uniref:pyridoxine 5'-phosphate synthase n=1 Tax=Nostoc sp. UHCC 0302 TaxID=3134896 RepID=UPI00311CD889